jgi:hypothetical protein
MDGTELRDKRVEKGLGQRKLSKLTGARRGRPLAAEERLWFS